MKNKSTRRSRRNRKPRAGEQGEKTPFFAKPNDVPVQKKEDNTFFQAKLTIGQPGDKYEQEADKMADAVVNTPPSAIGNKTGESVVQEKEITAIQPYMTNAVEDELGTNTERIEKDKMIQEMHKPGEEEEVQKMATEEDEPIQKMEEEEPDMQMMEEEEPLQKMEEEEETMPLQTKTQNTSNTASPGVSQKINATKGKGSNLPDKTNAEMSQAFGYDFSGVNVHTDSQSEGLNKELGAQAFTHGTDVYFNSGKYSPESTTGKKLLAHELTHVVQQNGGEQVQKKKLKRPNASSSNINKNIIQKTDGPRMITLRISWSGMFDDDTVHSTDLSAEVEVRADRNNGRVLGTGNGTGSATLSLEAPSRRYAIRIKPTAGAPNDRYKTTRTTKTVRDTDISINASKRLRVNRWNHRNVDYVWRDRGIDASAAANIRRTSLFGKRIRINELALPRVERTNAEFLTLSADQQQEITDSIKIIGGYARRTTSDGTFSNHSLGTAIDMNYNLEARQNYHWDHLNRRSGANNKALLGLVQAVVRTSPSHSSFDLMGARGMAQLEGSNLFNLLFDRFLMNLMTTYGGYAAGEPDFVGPLPSVFDTFNIANINTAITQARAVGDSTEEEQLKVIKRNWTIIRGWVNGADLITNGTNRGTLVGMIPLHEKLLEIMLNNGWNWGGDWNTEKDYMHFEDRAATSALSTP